MFSKSVYGLFIPFLFLLSALTVKSAVLKTMSVPEFVARDTPAANVNPKQGNGGDGALTVKSAVLKATSAQTFVARHKPVYSNPPAEGYGGSGAYHHGPEKL
ncbi:uncharacterized protein FA14DRAFT_178158 [Meira miltonrushii]|uniref:Uncharacterized protein n=1 Tax=Meira miltonrushii TaxID=1280837 RepID=A0A316VB94_9BASI|nr:uncharacterized protein FA14DRAFT_178158 [Meira miltonrushii]PWN34760.1 hypothetical protein FA14DRAFT_178158 [Meira miltonrushii]